MRSEVCIPLMQIASSVAQAVGGTGLDAVQPMKSGWYIYMHTQADRECLIQKGLVIVGKQITVRSEFAPKQAQSVKITLKDLPLHSIANNAVLMGLKEHCQVLSEVHYSNVWYEGKPTSIRNGDRFVYVAQQDVGKLPSQVKIAGAVARVFKPIALTKCKRCGKEGHHPSDDKCPVHASEVMADS